MGNPRESSQTSAAALRGTTSMVIPHMKGVHTQTHRQPIGRVETAQVFLANRSENWFEVKLAGNPC